MSRAPEAGRVLAKRLYEAWGKSMRESIGMTWLDWSEAGEATKRAWLCAAREAAAHREGRAGGDYREAAFDRGRREGVSAMYEALAECDCFCDEENLGNCIVCRAKAAYAPKPRRRRAGGSK